jgi:MarR family transcriptional regulator, organic hydroperoxide resistance regulator
MTSKKVASSAPPSRVELLKEISQSWRGIKQHMHGRISERARGEGMASLSQCSVLGSICIHTGVTVKRIASYLGVTSPAATQIVRELEAQELLKKVPNPADSRSAFLLPTVAGKRLLAKTEKVFSAEFEKMLAVLTDEELAVYSQLNNKIAQSFYDKQ